MSGFVANWTPYNIFSLDASAHQSDFARQPKAKGFLPPGGFCLNFFSCFFAVRESSGRTRRGDGAGFDKFTWGIAHSKGEATEQVNPPPPPPLTIAKEYVEFTN